MNFNSNHAKSCGMRQKQHLKRKMCNSKFEDEECLYQCAAHRMFTSCYQVSSEILTLALLNFHPRVYLTYTERLSSDSSLCPFSSLLLILTWSHSRTTWYSAKSMYEAELYMTATFIGQNSQMQQIHMT